jgi:hypothetical protein
MECWYPLPNKVGNVMVVATPAPPCAVPAAAPGKGTFVRRHQWKSAEGLFHYSTYDEVFVIGNT